MEIWGITGVMGSGKSEARRYLEALGYPAVDADDVARVLLSTKYPENLNKLKDIFGIDILLGDGKIDRAKIRKVISTDEKLRHTFESWLHPLIRQHNELLESQWRESGSEFAFVEGTRIIESGAFKKFVGLILVTCDSAIRKKRLSKRAEMSPEEQENLAKTQNEELMRQHATVIWDNSKDLKDLYSQIDEKFKR